MTNTNGNLVEIVCDRCGKKDHLHIELNRSHFYAEGWVSTSDEELCKECVAKEKEEPK